MLGGKVGVLWADGREAVPSNGMQKAFHSFDDINKQLTKNTRYLHSPYSIFNS
jgi:hypothetical protein